LPNPFRQPAKTSIALSAADTNLFSIAGTHLCNPSARVT